MGTTIKFAIFIIIAIIGSIYLGIGVATDQVFTAGIVLIVVSLAVCLALDRKVWLVLPFLMGVELTLQVPGTPSTSELAQVIVCGFVGLLMLTSRIPWKIKITELEIWMLLLAVTVAQVYLRNPAGLSIFGSGSVGGRAYAVFGLSLCTAALLSVIIIPPQELKTALKLAIIGGLLNFVIFVAAWFSPTLGYYMGASVGQASNPNQGAATRIGFLGTFGRNLSLWVSSFKSPLRVCLHPFWAPLIILAIVAGGLSGFRSMIAMVGLNLLLGLIYRGGFNHVVISAFGGIAALALLAIGNLAMPLPANIQRSLSFLPGTWEERHIQDTTGSSEWRFEIWREVLYTDRWIQNKWLGDGLGFSASELEYQLSLSTEQLHGVGVSGFDQHRESILASGDYHSGPVSTIRTIGYIGLAILLLFQIRLAVHAHRQIIRCRGTEWYSIALFIGIPIIWSPIFFVLIVGAFGQAAAALLLGAAMVRLLENNLPLPHYSKGKRYTPQSSPGPTAT